MIQNLVVRDIYSVHNLRLLSNHIDGISEFQAFAFCLFGNRKRGNNQNRLIAMFVNALRPFELLDGLSKSTILKQRGAAFLQSPEINIFLPFKKILVHFRFWLFKSAADCFLSL